MKLQLITILSIISSLSAKYCSVSSRSKYTLDTAEHKFMREQPLAYWYTDRSGNLESAKQDLSNFVSQCGEEEPIVIVYGLPGKDCKAGESASGFNNRDTYKQFIKNLKDVAPNALVILEPDALALSFECGKDYLEYIRQALEIMPEAHLDVGHWIDSKKIKDLGLKAKGYSLNLSNYRSTQEMKDFCDKLATEEQRCIIDTSRNWNGPSPSSTWCNYIGAGIGEQFEEKKYSGVWLKPAIELDGNCYGNSDSYQSSKGAGSPDNEWFNILWRQGAYANKLWPNPSPSPSPQEPSPSPSPQEPSPSPHVICGEYPKPSPIRNDFRICKSRAY